MNFGKMGLVVFVLGLVIAAGAGMNWMSLDRRAGDASVEMTLANNTYDRLDRLVEGNALREEMDAMRPWMIGGSIAAVLGMGMIFAGGGSSGPTRTCPRCAESVMAAAVVCKHCEAELQPVEVDPDYPTDEVTRDDKKYSYRALVKAVEEAEQRGRN